MFTVMKPKEFNLQFMKEANQNLEISQLHLKNNSNTLYNNNSHQSPCRYLKKTQMRNEQNETISLNKPHFSTTVGSPSNFNSTLQSQTMQNFKVGSRYSPSKYKTGYAFPSSQSTVPPHKIIPQFTNNNLGGVQNKNSNLGKYKYLNEEIFEKMKHQQRSQSQVDGDSMVVGNNGGSSIQIQFANQSLQSMQIHNKGQNNNKNIFNQKQNKMMKKVIALSPEISQSKIHLPNILMSPGRETHFSGSSQINGSFFSSKNQTQQQQYQTSQPNQQQMTSTLQNQIIQNTHQNPFLASKMLQLNANAKKKVKNSTIPIKTMYISPHVRSVMRNMSPFGGNQLLQQQSTETMLNQTNDSKGEKNVTVLSKQVVDNHQFSQSQREKIVNEFLIGSSYDQSQPVEEQPQILSNEGIRSQLQTLNMDQLHSLNLNDNQQYNTPQPFAQTSENFFKSISPQRELNEDILDKNNFRKTSSILSNLYRIDDRAIKFKQAKNELLKITNSYLSTHFAQQTNSRDMIRTIEENDWKFKKKARKLGIEIDSDHSDEKYLYENLL
eukprot:403345884